EPLGSGHPTFAGHRVMMLPMRVEARALVESAAKGKRGADRASGSLLALSSSRRPKVAPSGSIEPRSISLAGQRVDGEVREFRPFWPIRLGYSCYVLFFRLTIGTSTEHTAIIHRTGTK
ncbi:MAG: hypothetical protein ACTHJR_05925, partial [Sphingomonas sp.]|uniref:hypothetical protein n=1 Tax=Sphingomonas sp. TaxID=28214 RepID=UPI003F806EDD